MVPTLKQPGTRFYWCALLQKFPFSSLWKPREVKSPTTFHSDLFLSAHKEKHFLSFFKNQFQILAGKRHCGHKTEGTHVMQQPWGEDASISTLSQHWKGDCNPQGIKNLMSGKEVWRRTKKRESWSTVSCTAYKLKDGNFARNTKQGVTRLVCLHPSIFKTSEACKTRRPQAQFQFCRNSGAQTLLKWMGTLRQNHSFQWACAGELPQQHSF